MMEGLLHVNGGTSFDETKSMFHTCIEVLSKKYKEINFSVIYIFIYCEEPTLYFLKIIPSQLFNLKHGYFYNFSILILPSPQSIRS
jgi:hypothetical protein